MFGRIVLNHCSFIHKRIRNNIHILEKVTNSKCRTLNLPFSGFHLFVNEDLNVAFIITIERQFYFISFKQNNADNMYKILENNIKLIDSIFDDYDCLFLDYNTTR